MEFKDTNVDQLKLNIALGGVCDDSLDKIVTENGNFQDIFGNDFRIEVSIIGASHSVTVSDSATGEIVFKEVLANVDLRGVAEENSRLSFYGNEDISGGSDLRRDDEFSGIKYSFTSEILTMKELQAFRGFVNDTMLHKTTQHDKADLQAGDNIVLKYVFPCDVETPVEAQTMIKFSCVQDRMIITSYHVYPNNDAAFVSYSEIVTTKKVPLTGGFAIVSKDLFIQNMMAAGVDREKALEILDKSAQIDLLGAEVLVGIKEDLGTMFESFTQAAETARDKIENIDKDEVIENIKTGVGKILDSLKSRKE